MNELIKTYRNKKVIVTGHSGFKGSWLSFWLNKLGAEVLGISKSIVSKPSNFEALKLKKKIRNKFLDIRDLNKLKKIILNNQPDFIFHLAAQSLVKKSYKKPHETFSTNSSGTLNILEAVKDLKKKCVIILVTSDKSYKNLELKRGYKENDILGGIDPYSASKASAELIIQSYFNSFLKKKKNLRVGIARAGNVIGGGDWSENRLIPDCIKSWSKNKKVIIRNPNSTRPWQHVFEAVGGYLIFANKLKSNLNLNGEAFNFGPKSQKNLNVINVIKIMEKFWNRVEWKVKRGKKNDHYESKLLQLNCKKAKIKLKWNSILSTKETFEMTTNWYKTFYVKKNNIINFSLDQIQKFEKLMSERL